MKRKGYLIESIAEMENLEWAFYKAQKGKSQKSTVKAYRKHLWENLQKLQAQVLSGKRYIHKLRQYEVHLREDLWTQKEYQRHVEPLIAFTQHADAKAFRKKVHQNLGLDY